MRVRVTAAWLTIERLPAYAPELNPAEPAWGNVKTREFANHCAPVWMPSADRCAGVHLLPLVAGARGPGRLAARGVDDPVKVVS